MSSQVTAGTPRLFDVRQVAAILGVSTKTVGRMYRDGELPHVRLGRSVRFTEADVFAAIARARVAG